MDTLEALATKRSNKWSIAYIHWKLLLRGSLTSIQSVDLCDLLWRFASQGWFNDEEPIEPERNLKVLKEDSDSTVSVIESWIALSSLNHQSTPSTRRSGPLEISAIGWSKEVSIPSRLCPNLCHENYLKTVQLTNWTTGYHSTLHVVETCNNKGEYYSLKTLYQLLTHLHRHALTVNPHTPNCLYKNNCNFQKLHNIINNHFKALRKEGVGNESKHIEIITKDEENMLWKNGIIGLESSPKAF